MATGNITRLEGVWPETHERAVRDSAGVNLETKLGNINSDISQLSQEMNGSESYTTADLSQLTHEQIAIDSSTAKWRSSTVYYGGFISVQPGQTVKITKGTISSYYTVLKDNTYSVGTTPDYATGYSGRIAVDADKEFTIPADGHYIFVMLTVSSGTVNDVYQIGTVSLGLTDRVEELEQEVEELTSEVIGGNLGARIDDLEEIAEELSIVSVFNPHWEIGNITMRDTGWNYNALTTRVRLKQGQTLHLYPQDVVGLKDYTAKRYYIGWRKLDGTYSFDGWRTKDFTVEDEGFYVILITDVPETTVSQASNLGDLFFVRSLRERVFSMEPRRSIRSIAHQGYAPAGQSKNNLAEGYILAASVGFNYGECDLVFSSDKVPFCCHATKIGDEWVNAFYDPVAEEYVYFAENTASQILSHAFIDANHHVSTFEEVIAACKSVGMGLYVDGINNIADDDEWGAVFNIIKYYAMTDKTVFLATNETQANKILSLYSNAEISFLTSLNAGAIARSNAIKTVNNKISMDVDGTNLTAANIKDAYAQLVPGVTIEVYTINTLAKYKELMPYVVGITSDNIAEPML